MPYAVARFERSFGWLALMVLASPCFGTVIYNETSGDISDNQAAPNAFVLALGTNSIVGNLHITAPGDTRDFVALTIPAGLQLSKYSHSAYISTDAQGFTGFQAGSSFVGSLVAPGSYAGYAHFGTGATNGSLPATNTLNVDLLPIMADNTPGGTSAGATGFTPPLQAGTYTFLIQQTGTTQTSYQFDWEITAVPEPSTFCLIAMGGLMVGLIRKRGSAKS